MKCRAVPDIIFVQTTPLQVPDQQQHDRRTGVEKSGLYLRCWVLQVEGGDGAGSVRDDKFRSFTVSGSSDENNAVVVRNIPTEVVNPRTRELHLCWQSGALSLVESFIELKYFHSISTPAL